MTIKDDLLAATAKAGGAAPLSKFTLNHWCSSSSN
jgi:hypothetical protein